jgi:hypothetical protein
VCKHRGRYELEVTVVTTDPIVGTSFESFADAARQAFEQVPGDPKREGLATADVARMWVTKGGVVGATQFHVELALSPLGQSNG